MKKTFAFILVLSMALALCACGGEGTGEVVYVDPTPAAATAAPAVETPVSTADTAASTESAAALGVVLDYAVNDVQPGSSGCSLRGIKCAAMLLDWAAETPLDADGIAAAVETWKSAATEDALSLFSAWILSLPAASPSRRITRRSCSMSPAAPTAHTPGATPPLRRHRAFSPPPVSDKAPHPGR